MLLSPHTPLDLSLQVAAMRLLLIAVTLVFGFFAPWTYALPLTPEAHARRRWLPRWD